MIRILVFAFAICCFVSPSFAVEFRSIDGSGNNLASPGIGSTGQFLSRITPANYADGVGEVDVSRPNPRAISMAVFSQPSTVPDYRHLTEWGWAWGQFVDHDIDHTLTSSSNGSLSIMIPAGDPVFDNGTVNMGGQSINVSRAEFGMPNGSREQINNISAWIDASMVYGGRATDGPNGVDRADYLRTGVGGKLKVSDGGSLGDLLPKYDEGVSPVMANTFRPSMTNTVLGDKAYVAGDVRANEHTALLSLHTLFVREHNRLAEIIGENNPEFSDEAIYQRARKIVGAEIQSITYNEYLPSMGVHLAPYNGYDESIDANILNEFSTAGFRMGHSQINGTLLRVDESGNEIAEGNLQLEDAFFNPDLLLEGGLEPILRGLGTQVQEETDAKLVDGLQNQLFQIFIPGFGLVDNATDLASINIMRGRDHGLGTYNETRIGLGLDPATTFADISTDSDLQAALSSVYGSVDDVDLYVGMLSEDKVEDCSLGELSIAILGDQFLRLRDGDRFWYENGLADANEDLLVAASWNGSDTLTALEFVEELKLSDIIRLNSNVGDEIQSNVFFAATVPEPSSRSLLLVSSALLFLVAQRRRLRN